MFRVWRGPDGTGTILVKKFMVELIEGEKVVPDTEGKVVSSNPGLPAPPPVPPPPSSKKPKPRPRISKSERKNRSLEATNKPKDNFNVYKNHNINKDGKKVLYLPANSKVIFQTGMENAFKDNGFNLRTFDFRNFFSRNGSAKTNQTLKQICKDFQPDWIHMQLQFTGLISGNVIKEIKSFLPNTIITNWTGDVRAAAQKYFIEISKYVDLSLISSEGQLKLYRDAGCKNVAYWQIGVDPGKFHPLSDDIREKMSNKYKSHIVFCASHSTHFPDSKFRTQIVKEFSSKFGSRFSFYGEGWPRSFGSSKKGRIDYYKQNELYNGSKIILSVNHFNNIEMYFSDRQLISMASGTLTLSHYIPGLERYFENKKDLVWFRSVDECVQLAKYYLANPDEAREIGKRGAKKVLEQHSYYTRAKELAIRIGMVKEASDEEIVECRRLHTKERKHRVMGIVEESTDRRYEHRISFANIDFQGMFCDSHITERVAEYQPDLLYVDSTLVERLYDRLATLRRRMPNMVFTCFSDTLDKAMLNRLNLFDYVIVRKPSPEIENDIRVVHFYADKFLKKKDRREIVEEVRLVVEKAS
jgi:spore maturation protein CgeB